MIANCDYKHSGLCQNPILHDMEITSSVVSGYLNSDSTDMMSTPAFLARKNLAAGNSATLRAYKNKNSYIYAWNKNRVNVCYLLVPLRKIYSSLAHHYINMFVYLFFEHTGCL